MCLLHRPCPVSGWWPPAPPRLACSPGSAWPSPAPASRWTRSHRGQTLWRLRGSLQGKQTHTCTRMSWSLAIVQDMKVGHVPHKKDTLAMLHRCLTHSFMEVGGSGEQIPTVTKKAKIILKKQKKQPRTKSWDQDKLSAFQRTVLSVFLFKILWEWNELWSLTLLAAKICKTLPKTTSEEYVLLSYWVKKEFYWVRHFHQTNNLLWRQTNEWQKG